MVLLALLAAALVQEDPRPAEDMAAWFGPDTYPPAAMRARAQGRVGFQLAIDSTGAVRDCKVTSPSGSSELDEATCRIVFAHGRFTPGRDAAGRPVPGGFKGAVHWEMPVEARVPLASGQWMRRVRLAEGATVSGCASRFDGSAQPGFATSGCDPQVLARMFAAAAARPGSDRPVTVMMIERVVIDGVAAPEPIPIPAGFRVTNRVALDFTVGADGAPRGCSGLRIEGTPSRECPMVPLYLPRSGDAPPVHGQYTMISAMGPAE